MPTQEKTLSREPALLVIPALNERANTLYWVLAAILAMLVASLLFSFFGMNYIGGQSAALVQERMEKMRLADTMIDDARERSIILHRMTLTKEPAQLAALQRRFIHLAEDFRRAREFMLSKPMSDEEKVSLERQREFIAQVFPLQQQVVDMVAMSYNLDAQQLLSTSVYPLQELVINELSAMNALQYAAGERIVSDISAETQRVKVIVISIFSLISGLLIVVGILLHRRAQHARKERHAYFIEILNSNQAMSQFLANMSHEIRTPLTSIIGFAEATLDSDQTMQERLRGLKSIVKSSKHLLQVINDILDTSKIEAGYLEIEKIEINPLQIVNDVELLVEMLAREKGLEFTVIISYPIPSVVTTDVVRLKQILINLCSNAIKFTSKGSVVVTLRFSEETGTLFFDVVDTGIGMTPAQAARIFDKFSQADVSTTRMYGGTGLGLSISKDLAKLLGGDLFVSSEVGKGSCFTLEVPANAPREMSLLRSEKEASTSLQNVQYFSMKLRQNSVVGTVLLAEDTPESQALVAMFLTKFGASVTTVGNGLEAVEQASAKRFDLILMDMRMPVMDGHTAVRKLRDGGYIGPIIALTANAMKEDREHALQVGCTDFLTKPVDREKLGGILTDYLQPASRGGRDHSPIFTAVGAGDEDLSALVQQFVNNNLPRMVTNIVAAKDAQSWATLREEVHKLKGVGSGYGYPMLTEISGKLEFQIANENYPDVAMLVSELENLYQRIVAGEGRAQK